MSAERPTKIKVPWSRLLAVAFPRGWALVGVDFLKGPYPGPIVYAIVYAHTLEGVRLSQNR